MACNNKPNKVPVVFAFDEKYKLPASVAIMSLLESKNPNTEYEIFVMYSDLSAETRKIFDTIVRVNWLHINTEMFDKFPRTEHHYPAIVYYRLIIHDLLPQYDKVIWSDVDVFFKGDLQEIYNTNLDGYFWGGVVEQKNTTTMYGHKYFEENKNENIFYSGFMLINTRVMGEHNMFSKFSETIEMHKNELNCFDLEVLNASCHSIKALPFEYCMVESIYNSSLFETAYDWQFLKTVYTKEQLNKAKEKPMIIHYNYNGNARIWNRLREDIPDYYWKFLEKSPFFNRSSHYSHVTFFDYSLYILQCIGARILPIKSWRKKLREVKNEYYKKFKRELS